MKKKFLRAVAGVMTLLLLTTSLSGAMAAYAGEDTVAATEQENVLTVTQDMVGKNGVLTITGEWDKIVIPKEIEADRIKFKKVKTGSLEIESGNKSTIDISSGEVGEVAVVPAKLEEMTIQDVAEMIRLTQDSGAAVAVYQAKKEENDAYLNARPTIVTGTDAEVGMMTISGNVKMDLKKGVVTNLKVEADGAQRELNVNVSNYEGNVSVKQTERKDGEWMIARIKMDNSKVENITTEGDGRGNIVLSGQNTEVKDVKVEKAPMISLNVQTEKVEVPETAKNAKLTLLANIGEVQINADNAVVEVGNCATVESAKVEGDNVNISGGGTLKNVDITGKGAYVSTSGTRVKGVNNYVAPTVVGKVRDLGGLKIVIGDWFTDESAVPTTPEEIAREEYRKELMKKYNFTIERKRLTDDWDEALEIFTKSVELGAPAAQIFILDQRFVLGNRGLCYDLATLPELDFTEDKWNDQVREFMTYGTGIYGMSDGSSESEPRGGLIYNKKLFEQAGLDPNLPYELQKSGEWTWSTFKDICEQLKQAGVTPAASRSEYMIKQLVLSTGEWLINYDGQQYISNVNAPKIKEAVKFADDLRNAGYAIDCHEDPNTSEDYDNEDYVYHRKLFREEQVAMQFAEAWYLSAPAEPGMLCYSDMENLGFVCCPRPDFEESYHTYYSDNVAVIPACYDEQTAKDIAFAYNLWIDPAPGVEIADPVWKQALDEHMDPKAIEETLNIFKESGVPVKVHCIDEGIGDEDFKLDNFFWGWPYDDTQDFDRGYIDHVDYFAWEMEGPLAAANTEKKSEIKAPRPDGSVSEFFTCPYEVELTTNNTIRLTERKDTSAAVVEIPSTLFRRRVTELGQNLFNQDLVVSVTIPNTVITIGARAFGSCGALKNVNIPRSVRVIDQEAFWMCSELETLAIPETVMFIGPQAFTNCNKLRLQVVAGSYAEQYAKDNNIPYDLVESVGGDEEDVVIPDEEIVIPGTGTTPGTGTEPGIGTEPTPEEEVAELIYEVLQGDDGPEIWITGYKTVAENLHITERIDGKIVAVVSGGAFKNCTDITSVEIDHVWSIGDEAFAGCTNLTEVILPNTMWGIGERAFAGCTGLKELYIPGYIEELNSNVFDGCNENLVLKAESDAVIRAAQIAGIKNIIDLREQQ